MTATNQKKSWFILGHEPLLSAAEIAAVLNLKEWEYQPPFLKTNSSGDAKKLIKELGGTIKIAEQLKTKIGEEELIDAIVEELKNIDGKIIFGISLYTRNIDASKTTETWGKAVKRKLKEDGYSVRYVFNREAILSSVTTQVNNLVDKGREFIIDNLSDSASFSVAKVTAVQPFEDWGARDYGRPGRDDKSGMLPPKLALMMVNLAQIKSGDTVLDPFCGSGTVLTEALLLGHTKLIGSDISDKAVADTKNNLDWMIKNKEIKIDESKIKIFAADVGDIANKITKKSVNTIVTEPYLGQPLRGNETESQLRQQTLELRQLYIKAFKQFSQVLKPGGRIIFIIPKFRYQNSWIEIGVVKDILSLGFKQLPIFDKYTSLLYFRSNQRLGREIFKFTI